jgi:hypothetical protein
VLLCSEEAGQSEAAASVAHRQACGQLLRPHVRCCGAFRAPPCPREGPSPPDSDSTNFVSMNSFLPEGADTGRNGRT